MLEREGSAVYYERFFTYWTLREAWCKALGTGLAHEDRSVWFDLDGCDAVQAARCRRTVAIHRNRNRRLQHVLAVAVLGTDGIDKAVVSRFLEP